MDADKLWKAVLNDLEKVMSKPSFTTWLLPAKVIEFRKEQLIIVVENDFHQNWLQIRYEAQINDIIKQQTGKDIKVLFATKNKNDELTVDHSRLRTDETMNIIHELTERVGELEKEVGELKGLYNATDEKSL